MDGSIFFGGQKLARQGKQVELELLQEEHLVCLRFSKAFARVVDQGVRVLAGNAVASGRQLGTLSVTL